LLDRSWGKPALSLADEDSSPLQLLYLIAAKSIA
jgi:hypothetical protein